MIIILRDPVTEFTSAIESDVIPPAGSYVHLDHAAGPHQVLPNPPYFLKDADSRKTAISVLVRELHPRTSLPEDNVSAVVHWRDRIVKLARRYGFVLSR